MHRTTFEERNLIFEAIKKRNAEIVKMMLDAGVDLSVTHNGQTPLNYAHAFEDSEIIKLIKQRT